MKTATFFVLVITILAPRLLAQALISSAKTPPKHKILISANDADKLLVHKADISTQVKPPRIPGTPA